MRFVTGSIIVLSLFGAACDEGGPPPTDTGLPATLSSEPVVFDEEQVVMGQTIYVPAYSRIYHQNQRTLDLAVTLSLRNTDPRSSILVTGVRFHDGAGNEVRAYLDEPRSLGPLSTAEFLIAEGDKTGGSGAGFLVDWVALRPVRLPLAEAVMISSYGQQGVSFTSRGEVVATRP